MSLTLNLADLATTSVSAAPAPALSGTSLTVLSGTVLPPVPFEATTWPAGERPTPSNAEILTVTANAAGVLTVTRDSGGLGAKSIANGWQFHAGLTKKMVQELAAGSARILSNGLYLGANAGLSATGEYNIVIGNKTLDEAVGGGNNNTIIGNRAAHVATGGEMVLIGNQAGESLTTGGEHVGVGFLTLRVATTSVKCTAVGRRALESATGSELVGIGYAALAVSTAGGQVAVGAFALANATSGTANVAMGQSALNAVTTEGSNTGIGSFALHSCTGKRNTAIGAQAGEGLIAASENSLIGFKAGLVLETGQKNVFIGNEAGLANKAGIENTYIGHSAGAESTGSGCVFIGRRAGKKELGSNKLYISNTETETPLIKGDFLANGGELTLVAAGGRIGFYGTTPVAQAATFAALGEAGSSTIKQLEEQINKQRAVIRGVGLMA